MPDGRDGSTQRRRVTCQDAAGNSVDIDVTATSDETACATALRELNTWRAVRVLPAIGLLASDSLTVPAVAKVTPHSEDPIRRDGDGEPPHANRGTGEEGSLHGARRAGNGATAPEPAPKVVGLRIIHKAGPTDWIADYLARGDRRSNLGRALAEATRQ